MSQRGGIDLGGTKIQAVVVGDDHERARRVAPRDADDRRAAGRGRRDGARAERGGRGRGRRAEALAAIGVGSPGDVDGKAGTVTSARNLPDWEGTLPARRDAPDGARAPGGDRQRRPGRDRRRVRDRRGAGRTSRCSACSGAPASAAGSCSTASRGSAAAPAARSATWSSSSAAAAARAGGAAAWRPTRAAARWRPGRAGCTPKGEQTDAVQDHGAARPHRLDQRRDRARALRRAATAWPRS